MSHPDARGNARVRALTQHLAEHVPQRLDALLSGGACSASVLPCQRGSAVHKRRQSARGRQARNEAS